MESSKVVTTKTAGGNQAVIFRELMPEIPSTTYATFGLYKCSRIGRNEVE